MPRGSSSEVNFPLRRSWAVMMCSTVVNQCVSKTMTVSASRRSRHSARNRWSPATNEKSSPSLSSRRRASGMTMGGTCETTAAPTTSPMIGTLSGEGDHGMHIAYNNHLDPNDSSPEPTARSSNTDATSTTSVAGLTKQNRSTGRPCHRVGTHTTVPASAFRVDQAS